MRTRAVTSKVIFLDYDGPMIPARAHWLGSSRSWGMFDRFDPCAVAMMNDAIDVTGAKFVISASAGNRGREFNEALFLLNGMRAEDFHIDWVTDRDIFRKREDQIEHWLDQHPEVKRYAVVDDIDMTERFGERMVCVTYVDGLMSAHRLKLIDLLGSRENDDLYDHLHGAK